MKQKHLLGLGLLLLILIGIGVMLDEGDDHGGPIPTEYKNMVAGTVTLDTVTRLTVALGLAEPVVDLQKTAGKWVIANQWQAPVDVKKCEDFITTLIGLQGEFRSKNADRHDDYGVADKEALLLQLYTGEGKPAAILRVGKKPKGAYDSTFVRRAGEDTVYVIDKNLRSDLGLWGDDLSQAPKPDQWLNKEITEIKKDDIEGVALSFPDHALQFKRVEKVAPKPAKEKEKEKKDTPPEAPKEKEFEWKLITGGPGETFKQSGLDDILSGMASVSVNDIIDPAKMESVGLKKPLYRCQVTLKDGKTIELLGGRQKDSGDLHVSLAGQTNFIYTISSYTFENIFPKGDSLFDVKAPIVEADKILTLHYELGKKTIKLTRKDKDSDG